MQCSGPLAFCLCRFADSWVPLLCWGTEPSINTAYVSLQVKFSFAIVVSVLATSWPAYRSDIHKPLPSTSF